MTYLGDAYYGYRLGAMSVAAIVLAIAATGCGGNSASPQPDAGVATASSSDSATATAQDNDPEACRARPATRGDLLVRTVSPAAATQVLLIGGGWTFNFGLNTCQTTVEFAIATAPVGSGFCTQVAAVADNPGYDVDAPDPGPLNAVIDQTGEGC